MNAHSYDMLTHTFELEPVLLKERDTFFPSFDKLPGNEHQERTRILLAKAQRDKVAEAYSNFVKELPKKPFVNVDQLLNENPVLKTTMQNEDKALLGWWKKVSEE